MVSNEIKRYWKIQGMDGLELLFERKVMFGQVSEKAMKQILKTLTAKISLTEGEIIDSYAKKRTKIRADHLDVKKMKGRYYGLSCGSNPYVIATIEHVRGNAVGDN